MTKIGKGLKKHKHGHHDWSVTLFDKRTQLKKTFFSSLDFSEPDTADLYRSKRDIYQQVGFPHFCTPYSFYLFVSRTAIMLFIFSEESRGGSQPGKPGNLEI